MCERIRREEATAAAQLIVVVSVPLRQIGVVERVEQVHARLVLLDPHQELGDLQ
jgi:hypothetical protein